MTTDIIKEALETAQGLIRCDREKAHESERPVYTEIDDGCTAALAEYEALRERVKALEEQNLHFREVLAEANNKWRHEFSEAVDEASDLLFRRLSAPQHFTRALARATLNKEDE